MTARNIFIDLQVFKPQPRHVVAHRKVTQSAIQHEFQSVMSRV